MHKDISECKEKMTIFYFLFFGTKQENTFVFWSYLDLRGAAFLKKQDYSKFYKDLIRINLGMIGHFCTNTYFHSGKVGRSLLFLTQTGMSLGNFSKQHAKTTEQDV